MKSILTALGVILVGFSRLSAAETVKGFETERVVLYQTDAVLSERLPDPEVLAEYTKRLQGVCDKFFAGAHTPETLHIVVVLKPGKQSRVWFVSSTRAPGDKEREPLRRQLEAVVPVDVRSGPVAFAISAKIAGGTKSLQGIEQVPIPQEWQDAAKNQEKPLSIPDGILALVWPDAAGTASVLKAAEEPEFVTQVLEPTGGKIPRPKDWFYTEGHRGSTYMWTLSREDTSKGQRYTTGVRIQTFVGVKQNTGQSAKDFILAFVAAKKKEAAKVLSTCAEADQGLFTRLCLETEEGPYHIQYSLFWGTNIDIAIVSISGTTKELWDTYAPIFNRMSAFELIDMKRFEK